MSWSLTFLKPIVVPGRRPLTTLAAARRYLLDLPESEQEGDAVVIALECLLMAAEKRGPVQHAEIALRRLINGQSGPLPPRQRARGKKPARKYKIID